MPYKVLLHPYVTEKTMNHMESGNKLEFIVRRTATKPEIKDAFEKLFDVKVSGIQTRICEDGKHAIIALKEGYSAEDIGMRIGVF